MITLDQVRSLAYVIAPNMTYAAAIELVRHSAVDMVILGNLYPTPPGSMDPENASDPLNKKLVIGYIDVGEATGLVTQSVLGVHSVTNLPSWYGGANPGFLAADPVNHLYTVQYWNPAWLHVIRQQIDSQVAAGFDGVFLDVLSADTQWSAGNIYGNPVNPNATAQLAQLVADINAYVQSLSLGRPFYLIGNNPGGAAVTQPGILTSLNAVFNESLYFGQDPADGTQRIALPDTASSMDFFSRTYAGLRVFGNDYPVLTDDTALLQTFRSYLQLGYTPTVTRPLQTAEILTSGPVMFVTTPSAQSAAGVKDATNFMAAGTASQAVLEGGDSKDYFIGGSGTTHISAGGGNDVIYPHADAAYASRGLTLTVSGNLVAGINPVINVYVNEVKVVTGTTVTASHAAGQSQTITATLPSGAITSIRIEHTNDLYISATQDRNVYLGNLTVNGTVVPFSSGTYQREYELAPITGQSHMVWGGNLVFSGSAVSHLGSARVAGATVVDGGTGLDSVIYTGAAADFSISGSAGVWHVAIKSGAIDADTLHNVERLVFDDKKVALDITGNAGTAAKILGAVFGAAAVNTREYAGIVLSLLDAGTSYADLLGLALDVRLGAGYSDESLVDLLYLNLAGVAPSRADQASIVGLIENGTFTQASLVMYAAEMPLNAANIGLTGLAAQGLPYVM